MKNIGLVAGIAVAALLCLVGVKSVFTSLAPKSPTVSAAQSRAALPPELLLAVQKYWGRLTYQCNGEYYGAGIMGTPIHYRKFDYFVEQMALTETDRLNGVEWRLSTAPLDTDYQQWAAATGWNAWIHGQPPGGGMIEKVKGRILYNGLVDASQEKQFTIKCNNN